MKNRWTGEIENKISFFSIAFYKHIVISEGEKTEPRLGWASVIKAIFNALNFMIIIKFLEGLKATGPIQHLFGKAEAECRSVYYLES